LDEGIGLCLYFFGKGEGNPSSCGAGGVVVATAEEEKIENDA